MRIFLLLIACLTLAAVSANGNGEAAEPSLKDTRAISIRLLDTDGKLVEGAHLCVGGLVGKRAKELAAEAKSDTEWYYYEDIRSDANGEAHIECELRALSNFCILARHESRKIMAIASIDPAQADEVVTMKLTPEREIRFQVISTSLVERQQKLGDVRLTVFLDAKQAVVFDCAAEDAHLKLPPGKYEIDANGAWPTHRVKKNIVVSPTSQLQRAEAIDLPVARLFALEGKAAPEIPDVVGWKNTRPITLTDLRGRCVLLDFGGYWCGPCVSQMPKVFALHDKYHAKGLTIIWVHSDLGDKEEAPVSTVAELDNRLKSARGNFWKGRDIPFPVALVEGKQTPFAGGLPGTASSAAFAEYGIRGVPEAVLINRQGKVVSRVDLNKKESTQLLEKTLAEK